MRIFSGIQPTGTKHLGNYSGGFRQYAAMQEKGETYTEEGAVAGAVAGVGAGALIGLGVWTGLIPVIGPVLAVGTLGTILLNAAGGAALGGLAGALIGWGIPEEDAEYYENEVKGGRYLVTVDAGDRRDEGWKILHRYGGYNKTNPTPVRGSLGSRTTCSDP